LFFPTPHGLIFSLLAFKPPFFPLPPSLFPVYCFFFNFCKIGTGLPDGAFTILPLSPLPPKVFVSHSLFFVPKEKMPLLVRLPKPFPRDAFFSPFQLFADFSIWSYPTEGAIPDSFLPLHYFCGHFFKGLPRNLHPVVAVPLFLPRSPLFSSTCKRSLCVFQRISWGFYWYRRAPIQGFTPLFSW